MKAIIKEENFECRSGDNLDIHVYSNEVNIDVEDIDADYVNISMTYDEVRSLIETLTKLVRD